MYLKALLYLFSSRFLFDAGLPVFTAASRFTFEEFDATAFLFDASDFDLGSRVIHAIVRASFAHAREMS